MAPIAVVALLFIFSYSGSGENIEANNNVEGMMASTESKEVNKPALIESIENKEDQQNAQELLSILYEFKDMSEGLLEFEGRLAKDEANYDPDWLETQLEKISGLQAKAEDIQVTHEFPVINIREGVITNLNIAYDEFKLLFDSNSELATEPADSAESAINYLSYDIDLSIFLYKELGFNMHEDYNESRGLEYGNDDNDTFLDMVEFFSNPLKFETPHELTEGGVDDPIEITEDINLEDYMVGGKHAPPDGPFVDDNCEEVMGYEECAFFIQEYIIGGLAEREAAEAVDLPNSDRVTKNTSLLGELQETFEDGSMTLDKYPDLKLDSLIKMPFGEYYFSKIEVFTVYDPFDQLNVKSTEQKEMAPGEDMLAFTIHATIKNNSFSTFTYAAPFATNFNLLLKLEGESVAPTARPHAKYSTHDLILPGETKDVHFTYFLPSMQSFFIPDEFMIIENGGGLYLHP